MIRKQFWRNVLPAMLSFAFTGVYAIVDGFFVGRAVGDPGLAAVNLAYPVTALIQAVGTSLGLAGGICAAISMGRGDTAEEKKKLGNAASMLLLASFCATVVLGLTCGPILRLLGAEGEIYAHAVGYLRIICWGAAFQVLSTGLLPLIRNYGGAATAMIAMLCGFGSNIVLDALFVPRWGTAGAAVATVIGQAITLVPCAVFLYRHRDRFSNLVWRLEKKTVSQLLRTAVSPFGLTLSPNIVTVLLNWGALRWGGAQAVACYAVVGYVLCVAQLLLQGIGDGSQPLVGWWYGVGDKEALRSLRRIGYRTAAVTAALCGAGLYLLRNVIPRVFGASEAVAVQFAAVLPIFLVGLLCVAFLRMTSAWFYATENDRFAACLIYGEPLLLAMLLLVIPPVWKLCGVWAAVPATQAIMCIVAFALCRRDENRVKGIGVKQKTLQSEPS